MASKNSGAASSVATLKTDKKSIWAVFPLATAFLALSLAFVMPVSYGTATLDQSVLDVTPQAGL